MTIKLPNGDEFQFWFQYDGRRTTLVNVRWVGRDKEYTTAAVCSVKDRYSKAEGRRAALTKLLKTGLQAVVITDTSTAYVMDRAFYRSERWLIWREYFAHHADLQHKGRDGDLDLIVRKARALDWLNDNSEVSRIVTGLNLLEMTEESMREAMRRQDVRERIMTSIIPVKP